MKRNITGLTFLIIGVALGIHLLGVDAIASEEGSKGWRPTYDLIMRWLNFGILVYLLFRFLKRPLMNFLETQKYTIGREIEQLEDEKNKVIGQIQQTLKELDESEVRFSELKAKIVEEGKKVKQDIIDDAKQQSVFIYSSAKEKIDAKIVRAMLRFKAELIDTAFDLAMAHLPAYVTDEDNMTLVNKYISTAKRT